MHLTPYVCCVLFQSVLSQKKEETMAFCIILLTISALILLFFTPRSRYSLPILLLTLGIVVVLVAVLFQNFGTATYISSAITPFKNLDSVLYRRIGKYRVSMITTHRLRNMGTVIFLYGINTLLFLIAQNVIERKKGPVRSASGWAFFITLFLLPLVYYSIYSARSALFLYVRYFSLPLEGRAFMGNLVTRLDKVIHLIVIIHVSLPVAYVLFEVKQRNITYFSDTIVILLSIVTVLDIMFLIPFFSASDGFYSQAVFAHGFWFFGNTGRISPVYSSFYLLLALITLVFTIASAYSIFGSELVLTVRQKRLNSSITELNRNMMEVFHSEKNMLFSIQLLMQEAQASYGSEESLEKLQRIDQIVNHRMETISSSLKRIRELHIRAYSTDIRTVADHILSSLMVPEGITLKKEFCTTPAMCVIDAYHTGEALQNMIINSFEALQLSEVEEKLVTVRIHESRAWVMLSISDNGPGIERSMVRRVIMPFISTKSKNENWGIGLSYVYRVINAQLGQMRIRSVTGKGATGTRIDILLPRTKDTK